MKTKKVLSISIGSETRDHLTNIQMLGYHVEIARKGTGGDLKKAFDLFQYYDGKVDALGLGGANLYLKIKDKNYYLHSLNKIRKGVKHTPIGDGNRVKHLLERNLISDLLVKGISLSGKKVVIMSGLERYHLAKYLIEAGCQVVFADLICYFNLPLLITSIKMVEFLATTLLSMCSYMPYQWFYETGKKQEKASSEDKWKVFADADIIAGDFLQIWKFLPKDLTNKLIITNTTTSSNISELKCRGLAYLATSTPRFEGRSFGTNVIEALLLAFIKDPFEKIVEQEFIELLKKTSLQGDIQKLNDVFI